MSAESKTRSHEHIVTINASTEAVWKAITDADELTNWFPTEAEVTPGEGGTIRLGWGPELSGLLQIQEWKPGRRLRTTWMEPEAPAKATGKPEEGAAMALYEKDAEARRRLVVDWYLEAKGGKTVLRLVHSGFSTSQEWDDEYDGTNRGWEYELGSLRHYLENHAGRRRALTWIRTPTKLSAEEVWKRFMSAEGLLREGKLASLGAGDRFSIQLAGGDRWEGVVQSQLPPHEFAGTIANLHNSLFRIGFETCFAEPEALLWIASWDVPADELRGLEERLREMCKHLFA
jgi:uncharacterized protein YndB with AHSA1/START domain